jgi:hypothetical protein
MLSHANEEVQHHFMNLQFSLVLCQGLNNWIPSIKSQGLYNSAPTLGVMQPYNISAMTVTREDIKQYLPYST